ncbi:TetR family transcriptional regulator [Rhodococcoides trifolii]|nr:TetR family transcriptional regulator [Rhodococcus trifolii]
MGDSAATRQRLIDAGTAEFAERGIAGARVDRIAAAAQSNKAQIYTYFGSKEALFDAVFEARVASNMETLPLTSDDLPAYAVKLYDMYLADPALVRLLTWQRLERKPVGSLFPSGADDAVERDLADAQSRGVLVSDVAPAEMWSMLIALAGSWAQAAIVYAAGSDERPRDHTRRRKALARTVERAFCAGTESGARLELA